MDAPRMSVHGRAVTIAGQIALFASAIVLCACSPKASPTVVPKQQREALDQAKAVEGVLREQSANQQRTIDDASR